MEPYVARFYSLEPLFLMRACSIPSGNPNSIIVKYAAAPEDKAATFSWPVNNDRAD